MGRDSSAMGPFFFFLFLVCAACTGLSVYLAKSWRGDKPPFRNSVASIRKGPPASSAAKPCWVYIDSGFFLVVALSRPLGALSAHCRHSFGTLTPCAANVANAPKTAFPLHVNYRRRK